MDTSAKLASPPGQNGQGSLIQPRTSAFDPGVHLRTLEDGSEYLDARWRLVWFLGKHRKYTIASDLVHLSPRLAVVKVTVTLPGGRSAQGLGMAAPHEVYRYVETAQTHALARALALLGFGTESALDLDTEAPADGGVRRDGHKKEEATVDPATADTGGPDAKIQQPPQEPPPPKASQELPSWASLEGAAAEENPQRTPDAPLDGSKPAEGAIQCQECQGPVKEGRTRQGKVLSPQEVAERAREQTGKTLCPRCLTQHMAKAGAAERRQ